MKRQLLILCNICKKPKEVTNYYKTPKGWRRVPLVGIICKHCYKKDLYTPEQQAKINAIIQRVIND